MGWEKLELHIENLIPGVVILALLLTLGITPAHEHLPGGDVTAGIAFVSASYLTGAIANVLARLLLDPICKRFVRPAVFKPGWLSWVVGVRGWGEIDGQYKRAISAVVQKKADQIAVEVAKRRQTGRIVRSALIPAWLAIVWVLSKVGTPAVLAAVPPWIVGALGCAVVYGILIFVYAFAELTIYHEAALHATLPRKDSQ